MREWSSYKNYTCSKSIGTSSHREISPSTGLIGDGLITPGSCQNRFAVATTLCVAFDVRPVRWLDHRQDLYHVRRLVFIEEQNVPEEIEIDEWDELSTHVLARDLQGLPIGCGRLLPDGHIGRMAVLPNWRGRGVGAALLSCLLQLAAGSGMNEVVLSAQVHAVPFYGKFGFEGFGDPYEEAGIAHQAMRLSLATAPT